MDYNSLSDKRRIDLLQYENHTQTRDDRVSLED